jgi:hypothetical protein
MDALIFWIAWVGALAILGRLAVDHGVDTRDGYLDDHAPRSRV